jgi:serine/threonine-protein kinase
MEPQAHIDPSQLALLLDEGVSSAVPEAVSRHLEECPRCREQLERAAADAGCWSCVEELSTDDLHSTISRLPLDDLAESGESRPESRPRGDLAALLDPPSHPELLGQLNQFEIERVIGHGGMGVVFKGFDRELHRPVAIKLMSPHLAHSATARRRFEREARAAAAVVHPNVIPIHGVSQSKDRPFIVMQFIAGKSLQAHVEHHGPLDTKDVVRIGMQIAAGLGAAHQQGLIHRDIKPANILLEQDVSRVVITDFGLARAADELAMTQTGWLAGTPHYMSPEQARGGSIDARSDLFSLGGVLYFIATGREPFRAEKPVAVLHKICHETVAPARQIHCDIPHTLSDIIERLLEKSPNDRFQSAARVQKLLEDYLAELQQPDRRHKPIRVVTRRQVRRRWHIVGYIGLVALLVPLMAAGQQWVRQLGFGFRSPLPATSSSPDELSANLPPGDRSAGENGVEPPIVNRNRGQPTDVRTEIFVLEREIELLERTLGGDQPDSASPSLPEPDDGSRFWPQLKRIPLLSYLSDTAIITTVRRAVDSSETTCSNGSTSLTAHPSSTDESILRVDFAH